MNEVRRFSHLASETDVRKVIIIGAGPTGLALAQGLKKAGIPYKVYDQNEGPTIKRNWSMGVHWAIPALKELIPEKLFAALEETQVDPHVPTRPTDRLRLMNGATGAIIKEVDSSRFYRLRRDKFRNLLMEGIEVVWDHKLEDFEYSTDGTTATANFSNGTKEIGSVIVGADGPHSTVRSLLVGSEKAKVVPIDYASTMCFTKYSRERALFLRAMPHHPLYQTASHPMGIFSWLSLHDGDDLHHPENWTFYHYISFKEPRDQPNTMTNAELVAHQKQLATNFVEPWKSAFEWMPDDHPVWYGKLRHWDPRNHSWDNHDGRVTIAGDAAHPMTFQRGQGLNHALKDSLELFKAIRDLWNGEKSRGAAIAAYESEMVARGGEEVELSEANTHAMHNWNKIVSSPTVQRGMHLSKDVEVTQTA